jgi:hypothetical protein
MAEVMIESPVTCIRPQLDEGMSVWGLGSTSVIGRKEKETQQRHAPEETGPDGNVRITPLASHGLSRCYLMVDLLARGLFDIAARSNLNEFPANQPRVPRASEPIRGVPLYHERDERRDPGGRPRRRSGA